MQQQQSVRKKIHRHRTSEFHMAAEKAVEIAKERTMETLIAEMMRDQFLTTDRVFRTVYKFSKSGRPYTDLETDIDIQVLNGLDMGRTLHSEKSSANISQHIAAEMRKQVIASILESNSKISILVDESTTISKKSVLIMYVSMCRQQ